MSQLTRISPRPRQRRGPYRRWSAGEKAWYLAAFRRSGLSGEAFCRKMGVPSATFALWKREAREADEARRVAFARVAVVPRATACVSSEPDAGRRREGMRVVVRGPDGHEAVIDSVDERTAVRIVDRLLRPRTPQ